MKEISKEDNVQLANRLIKNLLVGSYVESFGILHQIPIIEFRNNDAKDVRLNIDSNICLIPDLNIEGLSEDEYLILCLNKINLKLVVDARCTQEADLEIYFQDNTMLKIFGNPMDETIAEPWQLNNKKASHEEGQVIIVAIAGGNYSIWN